MERRVLAYMSHELRNGVGAIDGLPTGCLLHGWSSSTLQRTNKQPTRPRISQVLEYNQ